MNSVELYENGMPKEGGLNDSRMGTTDYRIKCKTCGLECKECPGHFGHLPLAKPTFHISFLRTILAVLRCVCFGCSRILADPNDAKYRDALRIRNPKSRLAQIMDRCK